jgi:putative DNA-invertase from lambdoid prophage Rac
MQSLLPLPTVFKRTVAYLRVSTDEQTPENQKIFLESWARLHGYNISAFYTDNSTSGKVPALERPSFRDLLTAIKDSRPEAVLVYELSRVGRSFYDTLEAIKKIEEFAPLLPCSPKESFLQTTDPSVRKLLISIFSWVAEREREMLIERTKAGMNRAQSQGKKIGRPRQTLSISEIKYLQAWGIPKRHIATFLKVSNGTLYRVLKESE